MPSEPQETLVKISSARDFPSLLEERVAEFRLILRQLSIDVLFPTVGAKCYRLISL